MEKLLFFVLILEVGFLTISEIKFYKTIFTPITLLSIPYTIVVTILVLFGNIMNFYALNYWSLLVWIIALPFFWGIGLLTYQIFFKSRLLNFKPIKTLNYENKFRMIAINISQIISVVLIIRILFLVFINRYSDFGEKFASNYAGRGIYGHLFVLQMVLVSYFISILGKNKTTLITFILAIGTLFVYQVKGWIFIPVLTGLIVRYANNKLNINLKKLLIYSFIAFSFFILSYIPSIGFDMDNLLFFFNHFFNYLFAGVSGLSEYTRLDYPTSSNYDILLSPFSKIFDLKNIFQYTNGQYIFNMTQDIKIGKQFNNSTNVYTIFGELYLYSKNFHTIIYITIISFITYLVFFIAILSRNIWFVIGFIYWASGLFMGWFSNYYWLLTPYETLFFSLLIGGLNYIKVDLKKINSVFKEK